MLGSLPITKNLIFLRCISIYPVYNSFRIAIARLPWEAWEIHTTKFKLSTPKTRTIRLARVPNNIHYSTVSPVRRKARILAIMGDDKGLDFKEEKQALCSFSNIAEVEFTGWQPKKDITKLKEEIVEKIADIKGWDILFFAGHSNETADTGGELGIAPKVSIAIRHLRNSNVLW